MSTHHRTSSRSIKHHLSCATLSKLLVLALALFLAACAGATSVATTQSTSTPSLIPTLTQDNQLVTTVEQKPVPGATTVHVTETEFAIRPAITSFKPGIHYYFVVSNIGTQTHAFTFVPVNADGSPIDQYYQYNHALMDLGTIPPGTTQTINYTFKNSDAGHYEIACFMRGHYSAGMHIPVTIQ